MTQYTAAQINQTLDAMAATLKTLAADHLFIVGIERGGTPLAKALAERLGVELGGTLNINFYRDDFGKRASHPQVGPSNLPGSVDDLTIVIVDDVLHTGRTIRAALNEIFDFGRPAKVLLAVLASREDGRELPIQADIAGYTLALAEGQHAQFDDEQWQLKIVDKLGDS
ncbi:MAG: bifunctional pyr operon transcriptional regulator/uracil phosphoribosyltransferase PyrR [Gammaproteobacteria bacterium]|nr:bifunctional pyr operon transcriptional regulator/uracil phosphoribosyltransferase PyrR [Gammaproteobacteria bacterium]